MTRTAVDLRIEKMVISGVPRPDAEQIARATKASLERLLVERGLPGTAERGAGGAPPPTGRVEVERSAHADRLGASVASAVHGALGS